MEIELPITSETRAMVLPSLDRIRDQLEPVGRARPAMWTLMLAALFAATAGVSAAAVMILGPGEPPGQARTAALAPQ